MSRRRQHMAEPVDRAGPVTGAPRIRIYEFYDGATKNSLKRITIRIDYETREWSGTVAQRRKLGGNWRRRPATPAEIEKHRLMLPPDEIAHVTRALISYRAPEPTPLQKAAKRLELQSARFAISPGPLIFNPIGKQP